MDVDEHLGPVEPVGVGEKLPGRKEVEGASVPLVWEVRVRLPDGISSKTLATEGDEDAHGALKDCPNSLDTPTVFCGNFCRTVD